MTDKNPDHHQPVKMAAAYDRLCRDLRAFERAAKAVDPSIMTASERRAVKDAAALAEQVNALDIAAKLKDLHA